MNYTANPELDAARHDGELEAAYDFQQNAEIEAPRLVLKDLRSISNPRDWREKYSFHGGNSAEDILRDGLSVDDDIADRYSEFMIDATPEAKDKMLQSMADWFGKMYAVEIFDDYLESLVNDGS